MNSILLFLSQNRRRLNLEARIDPARCSCVMVTPRFRASSHVIFFLLAEGSRHPLLVAKVPRLPGDHARLDREVQNLRAGFSARPGGFDSIPRVIAYEEYCGHRLLIETALTGQPMKPALVRRHTAQVLAAGASWLMDFHRATRSLSHDHADWFATLVETPINNLLRALPPQEEEADLLRRTLACAQPLRDLSLPLVLSHEDLSHPNILISPQGKMGVVDWELAELHGLPAADLFFFLNYIAFSRRAARKSGEYLAAFHEAFFAPECWSQPFVADYQARLNLPAEALPPLFVLCWLRYLAGLVLRLHDASGTQAALNPETLAWLRHNRYYLLWRYALEHERELRFA